jgi:hypothetical protein
MDKIDDKILSNAQYRKSLSIAFFNATNAAIELISSGKVNPSEGEGVKELLTYWRNWFLEEHKNYYATVIANIGVNYRADESIAKLKVAKNLEELKNIWISLSADERIDGEILKEVKKLKKSYGKE